MHREYSFIKEGNGGLHLTKPDSNEPGNMPASFIRQIEIRRWIVRGQGLFKARALQLVTGVIAHRGLLTLAAPVLTRTIMSMPTVGLGDIVPYSDTARLFTVSIIVLGITVFATSISAVAGPVIGGKLKHIVKGGISNVTRKNHYLIVGVSPLAHSVYAGLKKRGYVVTVIVTPNAPHSYPANADIVVGDASDTATLHNASAETALAVLALRMDDAENAFVLLAIKDLAPKVRTIALVNDSRNLQRLRLLQPDMVFSPQLLAGELLARTLNNETIDNDLISHLLFGRSDGQEPAEPSAPLT